MTAKLWVSLRKLRDQSAEDTEHCDFHNQVIMNLITTGPHMRHSAHFICKHPVPNTRSVRERAVVSASKPAEFYHIQIPHSDKQQQTSIQRHIFKDIFVKV